MVTWVKGQNNINAYEYWFDSNYASLVNVPVSAAPVLQVNTSINTTGLNLGIHTFNIRFKDDSGKYSSVISQIFLASGASNSISYYQYWFDNDFAAANTQAVNPQIQYALTTPFDATNLNNGMHRVHVRFKESGGMWSSVVSSFFQKSSSGTSTINLITGYRYWLDSITAPITTVQLPNPVNPYELIDNLSMTNVPKGSHVLNIQFKDTTGLWSSVLSEPFIKNPLPIATFSASSTSICLGDSISFSNQSFEADSFIWNFGDGIASGDFEPVHYYTQPGNYTVTLTAIDTASGIDSTLILNSYISVFGDAAAQFTYISSIGEVSFNNTSSNGTNYHWDFGDGSAFSNLENPVHTYTNNGSYTVMLITSNICGADTIYQNILIEGLGIENIPLVGNVSIFPNPLQDECLIKLTVYQTSHLIIKVYDLIGNEVASLLNETLAPKNHEIYWKGDQLSAGIYLLRIENGTDQQSYKLIKNH